MFVRPLLRQTAAAARRVLTIRAIIGRELRVAARRPTIYRVRIGAVFCALALIGWKLSSFAWQQAPPSAQGHALFVTLSVLAFIYCFLAGVRATSDCISEEKRDGTLGLLFLTDLKGIDVVLGKLAATSLNAFYGLFAVLPALAIPLMLGGVSFAEFGRMALVLVNTLFFSLSMGLFVSAISRNERKAATATVLAVFAPMFVPLALLLVISLVVTGARDLLDLDVLLRWVYAGASLNPVAFKLFSAVLWLEVCNPIFALFCVLFSNTALPGLPVVFSARTLFLSLGSIQILSWLALLLAAFVLPRVWKDRPSSRLVVTWGERWHRFSQGNPAVRQRFRTALLNLNPYFWLVGRDRLKPPYVWFFLLAMVVIWLWRYFQDPYVMFDFYPLAPTLVIIHGFLKIWAIVECSHRLVEDRRSGALELLLCTPLGPQQIAHGQLLALRRQFALPFLALCALELLAFSSRYSPAVILFVQTMLLADVLTLMWVSMWLSLSARNLNHVVMLVIGLGLAVPWGLFLTALAFLERLPAPRSFGELESKWLSLLLAILPWAFLWRAFYRARAASVPRAGAPPSSVPANADNLPASLPMLTRANRSGPQETGGATSVLPRVPPADPQGQLNHGRWLLISLALALPWCVYAGLLSLSVNGLRWAGPQRPIALELRVLLWFVIGMAFDAIVLRWAKSRLMQRFRAEVLRQFGGASAGSTTEQPQPKSRFQKGSPPSEGGSVAAEVTRSTDSPNGSRPLRSAEHCSARRNKPA